MKRREFWNVIPQQVRIAACAIVCIAVLVGLIAGAFHSRVTGQIAASPAVESLVGIGMGLLGGSFLAIWVLCLGYVYADARRRAMRPVLWTLIAALIPNLLGFLLYFALRQPILLPCPGCGRPIATEQRFCSWCGRERASPPSSQMLSQAPGAPS